ncbi:MAG TPA: preprotein translocase subunit YajC [Methylocystis sp.]|nr:preprotein translocase subunit YajC [Methylocystis sp.]
MNLTPQAYAQTEQSPAAAEPPAAPAPSETPPQAVAPAPTTPAAPSTAAPAPSTPSAPPASGKATIAGGPPAQPGGGGGDALADQFQIMAPFLIIVGIVYFVVLRPQQRAQKAAKDALLNVRRGDVIATSGGLIGKVTKAVDDKEVEVELATNVRVRLLRTAITEVRAKSEPVKDAPSAKS